MKTIRALVTTAVTLAAAAGTSLAAAPVAQAVPADCSLRQETGHNPQYAEGACLYAPTTQRWRVLATCETLDGRFYGVASAWAWGQGYPRNHGEGVPIANTKEAWCKPGDALYDAGIELG
ncbi:MULTISPECIES: hypothetical protein [Kitasatospora]|uniref:hypothetical protein n=1 Tax=Kitasatospora TaxID=2063 RepID=UPI000E418A99|nr:MULTISPECIES: hypothetical protein [Kitasatospora]